LKYYFDRYKEKIGDPALVICLDAGGYSYEQLWKMTSLRGGMNCKITVKIAREEAHSGEALGIIPDPTRIMNILLERIWKELDNEKSELHTVIPEHISKGMDLVKKIFEHNNNILGKFTLLNGAQPVHSDPGVLYLNNTWRTQLAIIGDDLPSLEKASNILRPETSVIAHFRIPPNVDAKSVAEKIKHLITKDPPNGATVEFSVARSINGWIAPPSEQYLEDCLDRASLNFYGKPSVSCGEGGTIPVMNLITESFPKAQCIVTGVLGPAANAHCPNEFLEIEYTKKLIMCLSQVMTEMSLI